MAVPPLLIASPAILGLGLLAVMAAPAGHDLDRRLFLRVNRRRVGAPVEVLLRLTSHLGLMPTNAAVWLAIAAVVSRRAGIVGLAWMLAAWAACRVVKWLVARPRPHAQLAEARLVGLVPSGSSFPSSHGALALYTALLLAADPATGIGVSVSLLLLAVVVGYARLYLGAHYPSDVLAGGFVGSVAALGAALTLGALTPRLPLLPMT